MVGSSPEQWARALEAIGELQAELGSTVEILVLVHSHAWPLVLRPEKGGAGGTLLTALQMLQRPGTTLAICQNTLSGIRRGRRDLLPGIQIVRSSVGELVRRQTDDWAYIRPT